MLDVNPTLLVGLGGSGREILLRVRRRFYEAGFLEQPTWISYLWIDTAVSTEQNKYLTQPDGGEQLFDHVASRTALKDSEICDICLTRAELEAVRDSSGAVNPKNISQWFVPSQIGKIDDTGLSFGAHQLPQLGRLALFSRARDVCQKLGDALRTLSQPKIIARLESALNRGVMPPAPNDEQFEVYNECQAFIVGSLAGGTGAGICVDIAAMLKAARAMFQFETRIAVWGHFLLPPVYLQDLKYTRAQGFNVNRIQANGYRALQDIEHMSMPRPDAMKATWLHPTDPERAPEIRAPIYDTAVLYDGSGSDGAAFSSISDGFAQIAHRVFDELRIRPSSLPGLPVYGWVASRHNVLGAHRETVPVSSTPTNAPIWSEPYSMRFAASGYARAAFEAPRLRMMAAFTLAMKALQHWIGEPIPRAAFDPNAQLTEAESRLEHLGKCIESRLEQEFNSCVAGERKRWRDILPAEEPCAMVNALRNANEVAERPEFFDPFFQLADKWPVEWDPDALGERLLEYYFTGPKPRIDVIVRELIDNPPLEGWDTERVGTDFDRPGGLWAVYYALSESRGDARRTVVESALYKCMSRLAKRSATLDAHNKAAREKLRAIMGTYAKIVDSLKRAQKMFWVRHSTIEKLTLDRMNCYFDLQTATLKWLENVQKQHVCEALRNGFESMSLDNAKIVAALNGWRKRTQSVRTMLQKLLQNSAASASNREFGVQQILAQFRTLKPDAATVQLRPELQQNEQKLSAEILAANNGDAGAMDENVLAIQDGMMAAWRDMLADPNGRNDKLPPRWIGHVTDLPNFATFERLPFGEQIDYLAALGLAQSGAQGLLKKTHIRDSLARNEPLLKKLQAMSRCRLERRDNPRRNPTGPGCDPKHPDFRERAFFIGPAGVPAHSAFECAESDDAFQAECFRYDYFVPLPSVSCLKTMAKAVRAGENANPPIHALSEDEARDLARKTRT